MRSRKARADLVAEQAGLLLGVRAATSPRTGPAVVVAQAALLIAVGEALLRRPQRAGRGTWVEGGGIGRAVYGRGSHDVGSRSEAV
jgi:hypothetical protein